MSRITKILLAAIGGEGGGVLSKWLADAAEADGFLVQYTSIPGVAQRTGATTYYLEIMPQADAAQGDRPPVMALLPCPGDIDIMIASEILEAGRAMERGFITPDRTTLIASTHRNYSIAEKSHGGDGRIDTAPTVKLARELSQSAVLFDMNRLAKETGSVINAVLLGVLAGTDALPVSCAALEQAIRDGGIMVERNLAGFNAGMEAVTSGSADLEAPDSSRPKGLRPGPGAPGRVKALWQRIDRDFPAAIHPEIQQGAARLVNYQNAAYAARYLDHLDDLQRTLGDSPDLPLLGEAARRLAIFMSYEDVIRVAQLKSAPERETGIRAEKQVGPEMLAHVTEFLKPGLEEWISVLPAVLGRPLARLKGGRLDRAMRIGIKLKSTNVSGFTLLWLLACCRGLRPLSLRFKQEEADRLRWLEAVSACCRTDRALARAVIRLPRIRKGYGETLERGITHFNRMLALLPDLAKEEEGPALLDHLLEETLKNPEEADVDAILARRMKAPAADTIAAE